MNFTAEETDTRVMVRWMEAASFDGAVADKSSGHEYCLHLRLHSDESLLAPSQHCIAVLLLATAARPSNDTVASSAAKARESIVEHRAEHVLVLEVALQLCGGAHLPFCKHRDMSCL